MRSLCVASVALALVFMFGLGYREKLQQILMAVRLPSNLRDYWSRNEQNEASRARWSGMYVSSLVLGVGLKIYIYHCICLVGEKPDKELPGIGGAREDNV